ncbi:MAG: response regulator [Parcubacteria group bacterium]|nr:response regulator [Parcubacteria group bacterium]
MENTNKKYQILIVDDDNFMLDMYSLKFQERGFDVRSNIDSKKALEELREGLSPDVVLFDIVMPNMDGHKFLETIKNEKLADKAILIALSNQWQESDVSKAKELGVDDYIIKANTIPSEVLVKVEEAIKSHNK